MTSEITGGCRWIGSKYDCKDLPPGSYTLRLSDEAAAYFQEMLERRTEVAGCFVIDMHRGLLEISKSRIKQGRRDNVDIPSGSILAWHTHPGKCLPRGDTCALDCPSDADMLLVLHDCMRGTFEHWVACHTGYFVTSISEHMRLSLNGMTPARRREAEKNVARVFKQAHRSFEGRLQRRTATLDTFRPQWLAIAKREGFDARFIPRGVVPTTVLNVG